MAAKESADAPAVTSAETTPPPDFDDLDALNRRIAAEGAAATTAEAMNPPQ